MKTLKVKKQIGQKEVIELAANVKALGELALNLLERLEALEAMWAGELHPGEWMKTRDPKGGE